jgi:hypothetical protein
MGKFFVGALSSPRSTCPSAYIRLGRSSAAIEDDVRLLGSPRICGDGRAAGGWEWGILSSGHD